MKESFSEFSNDNVLKLSAALSYYTIFSLAPMLLLIISIVSFFFGREAFEGELYGQIQGLVGKEAGAQIQELIKNAALNDKSTTAAIIGGVTLLIGATGVFAEIQDSINYIWAIKSKPKRVAAIPQKPSAVVLADHYPGLLACGFIGRQYRCGSIEYKARKVFFGHFGHRLFGIECGACPGYHRGALRGYL